MERVPKHIFGSICAAEHLTPAACVTHLEHSSSTTCHWGWIKSCREKNWINYCA